MWGSESWGELTWQSAVDAVPALGPTSVVVLTIVLCVTAFVIVRQRGATR